MHKSAASLARDFSKATGAILVSVSLICITPRAGADGLKNLLTNLYGPEGFLLEPVTSHEPHFRLSAQQELDALNSGIASTVATLSPSVSVGGFTFDVERGIPMKASEALGPLLAERAETIGKGRLNVAATYTRVRYTRLEGQPLTNLGLDFLHEPEPGNPDFTRDVVHVDLNAKITQEILALFGTYGLTDRWDVAIVVPFEHISMGVTADARIDYHSASGPGVHLFGPRSSPQHLRVTDSASGVGDILVRTKYNFLRSHDQGPDMAVVGEIRLPTGDENELLGSGNTAATLVLVASKPFGPITPHLNIGYEVNSGGNTSLNTLRYVAGFDAVVHPRLSVAAEIVGYWLPQGNGFGDSVVDFAFGFKWNVVRNFLVGANIQVPLNKNEGLRPDFIWSVAAEYTF
jgi:hypothetical protein